MRTWTLKAFFGLSLAAGISACGGGSTSVSVPTSTPTQSPTTTPHVTVLSGTSYRPSQLSGGQGQAYGVVLGSDHNIWASICPYGQVGSVERFSASGAGTTFALPAGATRCPQWLTLGSDGAVWFTEFDLSDQPGWVPLLGRIDTSGNVQEFSVGGDLPVGLTAGQDGNLWYVAMMPQGGMVVGGFSPTSDLIVGSIDDTGLRLATIGGGNPIVTNPTDGSLILMFGDGGRIAPGSSPTIEPNLRLPTGCLSVSAGSDGNLYFQCSNNIIAKVSGSTYAVSQIAEQSTVTLPTYSVGVVFGGLQVAPVLELGNGTIMTWGVLQTSSLFSIDLPAMFQMNSSGTILACYVDTESQWDNADSSAVSSNGAIWNGITNRQSSGSLTAVTPLTTVPAEAHSKK